MSALLMILAFVLAFNGAPWCAVVAALLSLHEFHDRK